MFLQRRSLKKANEKLREENQKINVTLQSTIGLLQGQMTSIHTIAMEKNAELESKLAVAKATTQRLSIRLDIDGRGDQQ